MTIKIKAKPKKCRNCGGNFTPKLRTTELCCSIPCAIVASQKRHSEVIRKREERIQVAKRKGISNDRRKDLQLTINALARKIDKRFYSRCICCLLDVKDPGNGAHYHSVGSLPSLRFNLNNIHRSTVFCNHYSNRHISGYAYGLKQRYGEDYARMVVKELPMKFPELHLSDDQLKEALKRARKMLRDFDRYQWNNAIQAREFINNHLGIYQL